MWFNLDEDDQKLLTALVDKMPANAGELHKADLLAINLHAFHARLTDCIRDQTTNPANQYRAACSVSGDTFCDGDAIVSIGEDDGAYVMTWTWVSNKDAGIETPELEDEEQ